MRLLVIGLDCAAPALLFGDERLVNIRRLMDAGVYGRLESVIPPITIPAWRCMVTSRDPGSLGVYGFRNRGDHSYSKLEIANSRSFKALTMWDHLALEGRKSVIIGVPPSFPPPRVNGISVGCFMTPSVDDVYTNPPEVADEIRDLVGEYLVDVKGFRTNDKDWLREQIFEMSRKQFTVVRHYVEHAEWDYFHFVNIALDRVHHGFWKYMDPSHPDHEPDSPWRDVISDFYLHLDEEIGKLLELVDSETAVLVVSDHGAQALHGGFCVNEWLVKEGLLVLEEYPDTVTPFGKLKVDWTRTTVWSEGGYYARVFLNVEGREPTGAIPAASYESFRDEIARKLAAITGPAGEPLGTLVFKPQEIYREVRNVAPDLIAHFGALDWRSIGGVGYQGVLHVRENDTGPDDCNHAQFGAFILAAPNVPALGEMQGARLLDIAPTLCEVGGYEIPDSFQGRSLFDGSLRDASTGGDLSAEGEEIIRQRLSGLGYIS
ncbi:MAG TPA: alkaline phosphatase family protein [Gemmatimonadaceae bacterium]|nr:alkaline phosphatase family protein [Gemmatimonadaceae bacterium]